MAMSSHPIIERHIGITQALADAKNRAWRPFKFWLQSKTIDQIDKAKPEDLAESYSPLEAWEIRDCLAMRKDTLERCARNDRPAPPII